MQNLGILLKLSCYQLKISCYNFKIFYISTTVTTMEKTVAITQKNMVKRSKCTDAKTHQNMKKTAG